MVVIVDLDDDAPSLSPLRAPHASGIPLRKPLHHSLQPLAGGDNTRSTVARTNTSSGSESERPAGAAGERPNPNVNGFSAALSCYPVVRQLAAQLDLNTLHNLSRTCRQFRANLLEYRDQLIKHTLHCEFEQTDQGQRLGSRLREAQFSYNSSRQLTSGRIGKCARDMVGECQRCAAIVCRNCTMKPPPTPTLRTRHRRLCRTCTKTPLHLLTACQRLRSADSGTPSPPSSPNPRPLIFDDEETRAFTAPAFERTPCTCDTVVWLCQPCGKELRTADTMYIRGWTWRTRYSHYLGGVGTGAGEGNEGVECGRGPSCLAAKIVEHEIDCDAETLATIEGTSQSPDRWRGSSYLAQEIEGVGGVFKMKSKKQVRVGECVKVYEDEKDRSIMFLERENAGKLRSWCSWCERVVLGEKDKAGKSGARPGSSGSNSTASSRSST